MSTPEIPPFYIASARKLPTGVTVCKRCGHENLGWYRTKKGKWVLATRDPWTGNPNPRQIHFCPNGKGRFSLKTRVLPGSYGSARR